MSGIRPASRRRPSAHTISWVRPMANDGMSSTPFSRGDLVHDVGERVEGLPGRLVLPAAVGGLAQDDVGLGDGRRVADDRRPGPAEVAGEHDDRVAPAAGPREPHPHDRRAQDVAGVGERDVDALRGLVLRAVRDRAGTSRASGRRRPPCTAGRPGARRPPDRPPAAAPRGPGRPAPRRPRGQLDAGLVELLRASRCVGGRPVGVAPSLGGSPAWRTPPGAWPSPAARAGRARRSPPCTRSGRGSPA